MDKLKIPVWLLALAFLVITGLVLFSIATGNPIYIHGEPWGTSSKVTNVDVESMQSAIESIATRKPQVRCQILFRGNPNPGDQDSLSNTEYNTTCPTGYNHVMNSNIYSMGKVKQWQSLCCQVFYQ